LAVVQFWWLTLSRSPAFFALGGVDVFFPLGTLPELSAIA